MSNSTSPAILRINGLLDDNSFVEIGSLVTARSTDFGLTASETPSDGVITGHGLIDGRLVFVYAQDPSVMGGSIGEMHAKKIVNIYEMAIKMGAPVIGIIDTSGMRLQESVDALESFANLYAVQAKASGIIPSIAIVEGNCGGAMTVSLSMNDFAYAVNDRACVYLNPPDTVLKDKSHKEDISTLEWQARCGIIDGHGTEAEIFEEVRKLLDFIPGSNTESVPVVECTDDINRAAESLDTMKNDVRYILTEIADNRLFLEVKKDYTLTKVTGFIRLGGITIGVVADSSDTGELTAEGCQKVADFVKYLDAFDIPLLTLTNAKGYDRTLDTKHHPAKSIARYSMTIAGADIPKVNLLIGEAVGGAYSLSNCKGIGADMVFAWPNTKVGMMDAKMAVRIMYPHADEATCAAKAAVYDALQCNSLTAARRGYIDRVVNHVDTRKYLIAAFDMLLTKNADSYKKHPAK